MMGIETVIIASGIACLGAGVIQTMIDIGNSREKNEIEKNIEQEIIEKTRYIKGVSDETKGEIVRILLKGQRGYRAMETTGEFGKFIKVANKVVRVHESPAASHPLKHRFARQNKPGMSPPSHGINHRSLKG